jgi:hypothetical protein
MNVKAYRNRTYFQCGGCQRLGVYGKFVHQAGTMRSMYRVSCRYCKRAVLLVAPPQNLSLAAGQLAKVAPPVETETSER